jgi:hypothetical protein
VAVNDQTKKVVGSFLPELDIKDIRQAKGKVGHRIDGQLDVIAYHRWSIVQRSALEKQPNITSSRV